MGRAFGLLIGTFLQKIVYRVMAALGLSVIAFVGFDELKALLVDEIMARSGSVPSSWLSVIGISGLDVVLTLVISAYAAVFAINRLRKIIGIK